MRKLLATLFGSGQQEDQSKTPRSAVGGLSPADLLSVVPMIKAVEALGSVAQGRTVELPFEQSPASSPFAADMVVMYAVDRPNHLEYVSNEVAAASGFTVSTLHAKAVENLPSRLGNVQLHDCGAGVYGLSAGGNFEASLLLLDNLWQQLTDRLPGEPLAAVPSRDLLFVVGSAQPRSYELIAARANIDLVEKRYSISRSVLVRRANRWQAFAN